MLSFIYVLLLVIILAFSVATAQDVTHDLPYALAFDFQDTTLPIGTCQGELNTVTSAVYPVYRLYLVVDSTLEPSDLTALAHSGNRNRRRLLRGEGKRPEQRQLQQYCYTYCDTMPRTWLIARGCTQECNLRRRRQLEDAVETNENKEDEQLVVSAKEDHHNNAFRQMQLASLGDILTSDYYQVQGDATHLLGDQGDGSAAAFYAAAGALLDPSECRDLILNMTYKRIPLITNV